MKTPEQIFTKIRETRPTFHRWIFDQLRQRGYGQKRAMELALIECAECGDYADHWHTMTGTTLDDRENDLSNLIDGVTLNGQMACGTEAKLYLDTDLGNYIAGEWMPHCEQCSRPDDDDDDDDHDDDDDDDRDEDGEGDSAS